MTIRGLGVADLERARDTLADTPARRFDDRPPYFVPPRQLAMVRELSEDCGMVIPHESPQASKIHPDALTLIGSLARFVQQKSPELAGQLMPVAIEWAEQQGIDQAQLLQAVMQTGD